MNSEKPPAENTLRCLKPLWRTVRDGVPLAVFCILELVPLTLMLVLSGHDSLDSLEVVSLYFATDYTFIEIVHHAAGQAFQVLTAIHVLCNHFFSTAFELRNRQYLRIGSSAAIESYLFY